MNVSGLHNGVINVDIPVSKFYMCIFLYPPLTELYYSEDHKLKTYKLPALLT